MNIFQMFRRLFIFKLYTQEYEEYGNWTGQSIDGMLDISPKIEEGGYE